MIRKIQRIKSFGVFVDFEWPVSLPVFNRYNLIYGWNFSGKTTMSRFLRCFEMKAHNPDYTGASVKLECEGGALHELSAPENAPAIRVFNSDFVRENLRFDEGQADPIFVLGEHNIENRKQLDEKQKAREVLVGMRVQYQKEQKELEEGLEKALSDKARDIKKVLSLPDYEKRHFRPLVQNASAGDILADVDFKRQLDFHTSTEKKDSILEVIVEIVSMDNLRIQTAPLLAKIVSAAPLKRLKDNAEVAQWVRQGLALHKKSKDCQFCESPLPSDLLSRLAGHFSADYESLITDLHAQIKILENAELSISLPDEARFYPEFREKYLNLKDALTSFVSAQNASLGLLVAALEEKQTKVFTLQPCPQLDDQAINIRNALSSINELIRLNNQKSKDFEQNRKDAGETLKNHFGAQFAEEQDYAATIRRNDALLENIQKHDDGIKTLDVEILLLEAELSDLTKGAEKINTYLAAYFGKNDIRVHVVEGKTFRLQRGSTIAKNMSEGEKTAIAFAYFMARLADQKTNLSETIIVIDDPISSLDANHLFNTLSMIRVELIDSKQLFLCTHNYEFFSLVRDWFQEIEETKKNGGKSHRELTKWRAYLVEKVTAVRSSIREIPPELLFFRSEYHYLFATLLSAEHETNTDFARLFNLPNNARRFMEAFAGIMIPSHAGLKKKMPKFFPDAIQRERVWKFINEYSHNKSATRSLTLPDASECKAVVSACLSAVRSWNKEHYDTLVAEVSDPQEVSRQAVSAPPMLVQGMH